MRKETRDGIQVKAERRRETADRRLETGYRRWRLVTADRSKETGDNR